jgi:hypothetical protein
MQIEEVKVDGEKKLSVKKKAVETKVSRCILYKYQVTVSMFECSQS